MEDILFLRLIVNRECFKRWCLRAFLVHAMKSAEPNLCTFQVTVCLVQRFHHARDIAALKHHIFSRLLLFYGFLFLVSYIIDINVGKN